MDVVGPLFGGVDFVMREAALFAATGFAILGASDIAVDVSWLVLAALGRARPLRLEHLPPPRSDGRLAIFVPAWDEAGVVGPMLRGALAAWGEGDWRIYVGGYPNDPATVAEIGAVADPRIRLVVGDRPGPTTKADCLNTLWRALLADEVKEGQAAKAVILHDAEDVVHADELTVFAALIERWALVQLPVVPLIDRGSRWVGGHYADEFAEAHGKELIVRGKLGAALPSAGVGCALERGALGRLAAKQGGLPFDGDSLTEDYEIGLKLVAAGGRGLFARVKGPRGLVATREFFPGTVAAAVRQKARWMSGIALSGWDRLGWTGGVAERWMRCRDRQSLLAALLLFAGYLATLAWLVLKGREGLTGVAPPELSPLLATLVQFNLALLLWRLVVRSAFTAHTHGLLEGLRAIPRAIVSNGVAMLAAAAALCRYRRARRSGEPAPWGKTAHAFPVPAE